MKKMIKYTAILCLLTSCGMYADMSDAEYMHKLNIQKQIDLTQAQYNYTIDSLYNEYYKEPEKGSIK